MSTFIRTPAEFAAAFCVSRETSGRLETYASILQHWQRSINLVSSATLPDLWQRHMADSAQLVDLAPPAARAWLDLGSGAGFPGMVIAILLAERRPEANVHLVESNAKKCAFLREVARQTGAPVEIHAQRIEQLVDSRKVDSVDVVTARALAPLGKLLGYAQPFLGPRAIALFPKGREVSQEIAAAQELWAFEARLVPSGTDAHGQIAIISAVQPKEGPANERRDHGA